MSVRTFFDRPSVGIVGLGHALPTAVRDNQSEVYTEPDPQNPFRTLFRGYGTRRVLGPDESLARLMADACRPALSAGACEPESVDLLTGFASVAEFVAPNELFAVHRMLGLPETAEVLAVADEFTAFLSGLRLACERVWSGSSRAALVACGCRWSGNVDYRDPVSVSIGDGAGAALVGSFADAASAGPRLRLVGWNSEVPRTMYGVMRMSPRKGDEPTTLTDADATTRSLFNMLRDSEVVFRDWGVRVPPRIATDLLSAAGVERHEVTCIAHQASGYLLEAWQSALAPVHFEDTMASLGNMTLASLPVTLCLKAPALRTRFVLLLGLGLGIHVSACLLEQV
jgi:3-oxoacyl-[acyl-carrier-protein] synthase-3